MFLEKKIEILKAWISVSIGIGYLYFPAAFEKTKTARNRRLQTFFMSFVLALNRSNLKIVKNLFFKNVGIQILVILADITKVEIFIKV